MSQVLIIDDQPGICSGCSICWTCVDTVTP